MQLEEDELADLIAASVKAAVQPLISRVSVLETRDVTAEIRERIAIVDARMSTEAVTLKSGLAALEQVESRDASRIEGYTSFLQRDLAAVGERVAAVEAKVADVSRHGKDGTPGRDGTGLADALMTKDGHLVLTFSDGTTRAVGRIVGDNGRDGLNGKDGSSFTTGIGAPAALGGQGGDVYVDAKTGDVYQWR